MRDSIRKFFSSYSDIELVFLFGSFSQNRSRKDSDVDVAIMTKSPLCLNELLDRKLKLASSLGREVDLIDLSQVHGALLEEVLCKGEILIRANPESFARLLKRMWYEKEDDQRFSEKTIKERLKLWQK